MNSIVSVQGLLNEVCEKLKGVKESLQARSRKSQKHLQLQLCRRQREEIIIFPQTMLHTASLELLLSLLRNSP